MNRILRNLMVGIYLINAFFYPLNGEQANKEIGTTLQDIQVEGDSVTLKLSQVTKPDVFTMESPWRLVVELPETSYGVGFKQKEITGSLVKRVRGYQFKENPLISRVVLELKSAVDYKTTAEGSAIVISLKKNDVIEEQQQSEVPAPKKTIVKKSKTTDLLQALPTEVVTLDFESADIKDVIRLMSETSNINIIFGPEVNGNISIHLKKVPFDEAFRTILNLKGLVASQLGTNILRVTTPELLAKERSKAVTFTKTVSVNYLKASDVQNHLQSVMSSSGRKGTITVVPETNSLVITDSEEGIDQAERLITQLDIKPKQVMIEARIVEINLTNGLDIGVQWEYAKQNNSGANSKYTGIISDKTDDLRIIHKDAAANQFGAAQPPIGTGVNLAGPTNAAISFGFVKDASILDFALQALIIQSKAKILSSPKVVTINGQQAQIQAVQDIPFKTSTVSNGVTSESFKTVSAGIILTVTPTINAENRVTLVVKPESSIPSESKFVGANPIIQTRNAQTTVIVKDGDTLVIGGLISDKDEKVINKVPLLGDIPIIGAFFRHTKDSKERNELLVFVTPRIIRD